MPTTHNIAPADTLAVDTLAVDTAAAPRLGIVIQPTKAEAPPQAPRVPQSSSASSWIILALVALFMLIALRYRKNFRFLGSLTSELTSGRRRRNMFDDTAAETTFVILLNLLCVASVGILLACATSYLHLGYVASIERLLPTLGRCLLLVAGYYGAQWAFYNVAGRTFADGESTVLWMRGFSSGQGILALALFPISLITMFYPTAFVPLAILALVLYFTARVLFIFKGFRIFSRQNNAYLLFLYYLCGVEIVPVILVWTLAAQYCFA